MFLLYLPQTVRRGRVFVPKVHRCCVIANCNFLLISYLLQCTIIATNSIAKCLYQYISFFCELSDLIVLQLLFQQSVYKSMLCGNIVSHVSQGFGFRRP